MRRRPHREVLADRPHPSREASIDAGAVEDQQRRPSPPTNVCTSMPPTVIVCSLGVVMCPASRAFFMAAAAA